MGLDVVSTGVESQHLKTPIEAPIASALNAWPLAKTFQIVILEVQIITPVFSVVYNPYTALTDDHFRETVRRFRKKEFGRFIGSGFDETYTCNQNATTYYPSVSSTGFSTDIFNTSDTNYRLTGAELDPGDYTTRGPASVSYPTGAWGWAAYDTRGDEYIPAEVEADIEESLDFLDSQDMDEIWAGTDTFPFDGYWHRYPSEHWATVSPETNQPEFLASNVDVTDIAADLAFYNSPTWSGDLLARFNGYSGNNSNKAPANRSLSSDLGFINTKVGWAQSIFKYVAQRAQIKATSRVRYVVAEVAFTYSGYLVRPVSSGLLENGDILELPRPTRLDFPFAKDGRWVTNIDVCFFAEMDPGDFLGTGTVYVSSWS